MIGQVYQEMIEEIGVKIGLVDLYNRFNRMTDSWKSVSGHVLQVLLLPISILLFLLALAEASIMLVLRGLQASLSLYDLRLVASACRFLEKKAISQDLSMSDLDHLQAMAEASLQSAETRLLTWGLLLAIAGIFLSYEQIRYFLEWLLGGLVSGSSSVAWYTTLISIAAVVFAISIFRIPYEAHVCTAIIQAVELVKSEFDKSVVEGETGSPVTM